MNPESPDQNQFAAGFFNAIALVIIAYGAIAIVYILVSLLIARC